MCHDRLPHDSVLLFRNMEVRHCVLNQIPLSQLLLFFCIFFYVSGMVVREFCACVCTCVCQLQCIKRKLEQVKNSHESLFQCTSAVFNVHHHLKTGVSSKRRLPDGQVILKPGILEDVLIRGFHKIAFVCFLHILHERKIIYIFVAMYFVFKNIKWISI